jgi:hypothetical protein
MKLKLALCVHDHLLLLLVEKLPNFCHSFEVVLRNLVEVSLARSKLLLGLLLHDLEVKAQEALNSWDIGRLERRK